jgi:hypothetical protein
VLRNYKRSVYFNGVYECCAIINALFILMGFMSASRIRSKRQGDFHNSDILNHNPEGVE